MNTIKTQGEPLKSAKHVGAEFFVEFWEESWTYIKTVVDVLREPVIILDKNFKVLAANEAFYELFQVEKSDTEGKIIYKLGNGQWDIPALRKLLENILIDLELQYSARFLAGSTPMTKHSLSNFIKSKKSPLLQPISRTLLFELITLNLEILFNIIL